MRYLLLVIIFFGGKCEAQKINSCNYKKVDTILQYKNVEIIIYKNKQGKQIADTIWYPLRCEVNIKEVGVMIIDEDKKIKRQ